MGAVAVTGSNGRLGRALVSALRDQGVEASRWSRPDYDLDDPAAARRMFEREHPATVIHSAAWTDVEGCARDPMTATRRNADAVGELAEVCAANDARLVFISTNEVFDGRREDQRGYVETDAPRPINPYGLSKQGGESQATEAFGRPGTSGELFIIRTSWLFGPPGNDFPTKILAAADRLPVGDSLKVVEDEVGSPTYSVDLAGAILELLAGDAPGGTYHLVNEGRASRLEEAEQVLQRCRPNSIVRSISRAEFVRESSPPAWAVLDAGRAASVGVTLRSWQLAIDDYSHQLCAA